MTLSSKMKSLTRIQEAVIIVICLYGVVLPTIIQAQDITEDDKSFQSYNLEILKKFEYKDYLAAIFENEDSRQGFAKFVNNHLTDEIKADLKAVRVFKKVGNEEMPAIAFSSSMDSWLGVLPQWKRFKKFLFREMEAYVSAHPQILENIRTYNPNKPIRRN